MSGHLVRATRWVAPSVVAACAGAVAEGAWESVPLDRDPLGIAASIGFVALVAVPVLAVVAMLVRGAWAAARPTAIADAIREAGGGMPKLAGWLAVAWLGLLWVAWAAFQGTWMMANWTAFKPMPVSFALPLFTAGAALAGVLLSRPVALAIAFLARKLDARRMRRRPARRSLFRPQLVVAYAAFWTAALGVAVWFFARSRIGAFDLSVAYGPAVAVACVIAVHATWRAIGRARWLVTLPLAAAMTVAGIAAGSSITRQPSLVLAIWGDQPIARLAIARAFDLDAIRSRVSLARFHPIAKPGAPPAARPDLVLVTFDAVRADHTPPYGGKAEMPGLHALAERGTVFEWTFAPSNDARRSLASIAIGLQPNRVHARDPRHVLLAERLAAAGYETAGFLCCDEVYGRDLRRGLAHVELDADGRALARRAHAWLVARERGASTRPLFLWLHVVEPRDWMIASGEPHSDAERTRNYDRGLAAADAALAELMSGFADRGPDRQPIMIVTADHGEGLGDHGQPFHATDLYDAQLRVPLVIAGPGIKPGRVVETVSLVDLVPTIVELAGYAPSTGNAIDGRSIVDLLLGKRPPNANGGVAFAYMPASPSVPNGLAAVVKGSYKLVANDAGGFELFNVHTDPDENFNLISHLPTVLSELKTILADRERRAKQSPF